MPNYTVLSASTLKKMIINGAINLKNNQQEIDSLNVFPVPDGDTGTNMSMTMMSGVKDIQNLETSSIVDICKTLSRGLLMGARGNSGVILSQYFRGFYFGLKDLSTNECTVKDFINALVSGYEMAYKAVMNPVEGTILTVVRESGEFVNANIDKYKTVNEVMDDYIKQAEISLANTPNILPVLKEANVVDSGGAGFIKVAKGMKMALEGEILELESANESSSKSGIQSLEDVNIEFGYCTEFIVNLKNKENFDVTPLRSSLSLIGDSLVVVQDDDLLKIHVHTNTPGVALNLAQEHGEFITLKIENMRLQHSEIINEPKNQAPKKDMALIAVCFGEGIQATFKELGVDYIIDGGQTMNPSTEDFINAIKAVNAKNVIIIPNNSNVILAAEQSVSLVEDVNVGVLKAKTIASGYASLMVYDASVSLEENLEAMKEAVSNVISGEVTYAVRDTEISGVKIKSGDYMGICNGKITTSVEKRVEAAKNLLKDSITEDTAIVTIFYGLGVEEEEVSELEAYCNELNSDVEVEVINGKQDIYSYIIAFE